MRECPCCSGRAFETCCEPFIVGKAKPDTPEQLMRSRYTAFTLADINYIRRTQSGAAAKNFDVNSTKVWARSVEWLGLSVMNATQDGNKGTVEFRAEFNEAGQRQCLHELSHFYRQAGKWMYVKGEEPE